MTNKKCDGDHSIWLMLVVLGAGLTVMLGFAFIITQHELETVGDAVCADAGHGPFVRLKDSVIQCVALPTGQLDGLRVQAVPT